MGWGPPWTPQPNLDADFFLALLEGVAAQHLHFGDDLWGGMRGRGRGGGQGQVGAPTGPRGSTHLHGADLLPPAVQHFEDGPEGAFGHEAQNLGGFGGGGGRG